MLFVVETIESAKYNDTTTTVNHAMCSFNYDVLSIWKVKSRNANLSTRLIL